MKGESGEKQAVKQSLKNPLSTQVGVELRAAAAPVQVRYLASPAKITKPKSIHPRRLPPLIVEGQERPFHSLNTRAVIHQALDAAQDLVIKLNTTISQPAQNQTASNVGEPSLSANGDVVFYTGNWYAALSTDGGNTFSFIDPSSFAQPTDPPGVTFCCDQVVNYMPSIDMFVWLMQYGPSTGDNIQRLAFAKTSDVKAGKWRLFDITTQMLNVPKFFMDFPDLAVGSSFLYVTTNCFGPDGQTAGSAVARIPLTGIAQGSPSLEKFVSMDLFAFRVAQSCTDTAYFAAHKDTSTLAVFSWPENQAAPTSQEIPIARWIGTNGYISRTPDGRRWLDRADPRLTGATLAGDELWFAWSADTNSNHRPKPFVQIARIASKNMTLIEDINLFDADSAIAYAGLATNANNEVGVSYMIGGAVFPSHVVGILSNNRLSVVAGEGQRSPLPNQQGHYEWGDFLTVRPVFPDRKLFAGAGYTLAGTKDGDNQDATPRFVIFGRRNDVSGAAGGAGTGDAPGNGGDGAAGGNGPGGPDGKGGKKGPAGGAGTGDGPITDVNQLSVVSTTVAAEIKAACGIFSGARSITPQQVVVAMPELVTKPGSERWPVKTGQDPDRNAVGKNIVNGTNLGAGIVPTTVEELISIPRPPGLEVVTADPPAFQNKRSQPVETTIWQLEVTITVVNQEADGDYHLVIMGASGATMVAEVPTPTTTFVGDSPWLANIRDARQAVDDKLIHTLSPQDFVLTPGNTKLVPRDSLSGDFPTLSLVDFKMPESFRTPLEGTAAPVPTFQTAVKPTKARITGVGFFDRAHGATGAAPNVIEIHSVLKIEWL
jgi:hypothetical protein